MDVKNVAALVAAVAALLSAYQAVQVASDTDYKKQLRSYYGSPQQVFTIKFQSIHRGDGEIAPHTSP